MSEARRIWGLVLAMAGVGSGFIVALRIGFAVSGGPTPAELESSVAAAGFILVLVLIYALSAVLRLPPGKRWGWPMRRYRSPIRLSLSRRRFERERQHRLVQLAQDPVHLCPELRPLLAPERASQASQQIVHRQVDVPVSV